ncbi:2Fe-2S iron-sulfur cluster-binding protein [Sphingobium sp. BS19]|uniref:2Fe-2S iron-sulfur cluster-binding protein n=1 Tax=Sphingobium sp. BS19 TaxID=3018973 RepID=UPI0022EF49FD|nr:2Fe-2S iron-sulfur cluster-binding protein [Sphingobium sp. BS19]GLJ00452.1 ferredoxin [Sphingobium sp. BS19]
MPEITYIEFNGNSHPVDVPEGFTVMEGAHKNGIPGIKAECGGSLTCATCHVYVDPAWTEKLSERSDIEEALLECAYDVRAESRLSCQIRVTTELDGLVVRMPEHQT